MSGGHRRAAGRRWYREPLVWLVIAIPAASVVMGGVMIWLALASDDGLVTDDYYRKGLEINQVLDRDRAARRLGLAAELEIDPAAATVRVRLAAAAAAALPARFELALLHATRAGLDRRLLLERDGDGGYRAALPALAAGAWNIEIGTPEWRLTGRLERSPRERLVVRLGAGSR